ncbi:MAG: type II toxin-antitoxin system YoeB family toxin [Bacteroidales bacterium]|nr:type II toxin-antitoxin system YoeB family toxin [Bacteroidales bacterium]
MKYVEMREALKDKKQIFKSYPKSVQNKLDFFVKDVLDNPRSLNTAGNPEQLRYSEKEIWSRELTKKDRIVYGIESGANYNMPEESEIIVFYQYLGHYQDK